MTLGETLKEIWPYLATLSTAGIIPFAVWFGRRYEKKDERDAAQEERRTKAQEAIVPAIQELKAATTSAIHDQSKELGAKIDGMKREILDAVEGHQLADLKEQIARLERDEITRRVQ